MCLGANMKWFWVECFILTWKYKVLGVIGWEFMHLCLEFWEKETVSQEMCLCKWENLIWHIKESLQTVLQQGQTLNVSWVNTDKKVLNQTLMFPQWWPDDPLSSAVKSDLYAFFFFFMFRWSQIRKSNRKQKNKIF